MRVGGPPRQIRRMYTDMEIINLVLGEPAEFKSRVPGNGHIFTTEVTDIWINY